MFDLHHPDNADVLQMPRRYARHFAGRDNGLAEDLEDLFNDALIDAARDFKPELAHQGQAGFKPWLRRAFKLAYHNRRSTISKRQQSRLRNSHYFRRAAVAELVPADHPEPWEEAHTRLLAEVVRDCFKALHPDQLDVLQRRLDGATLREVASARGCSAENVRQLEAGALKRVTRHVRSKIFYGDSL